jgi:hypothetical protein
MLAQLIWFVNATKEIIENILTGGVPRLLK